MIEDIKTGEDFAEKKLEKKKKQIIAVIIVIIILIISVVAILQLTTSKEDKRTWMNEQVIEAGIIMYLNEKGYSYEDMRYIKTEKIRETSDYILYETKGQIREVINWYDFIVDIKVYADRVETVNFQILP